MKKKIPALFYLLIITALLVLGAGAYLKYVVLAPLDLYQDESPIAVPFLLMSDEQTRYMLEYQMSAEEIEATEAIVESEPTEEVTEETAATEATEAVTELMDIDESWFDDALFIGDSRTKAMQTYGKLGEADYFAEVGLSVYGVQSTRVYVKDVGKVNLKTLLTKKDYGKIYIYLGLNEIMGIHDTLIQKYQELIEMIQEVEPDAVIILMANMTVSREKAASKDCFHPDYIASLNNRIKALAVGDKMRYIDVNEWIADDEGFLPDGWSKDGTHLHADGCYAFSQWILENAATLGIE